VAAFSSDDLQRVSPAQAKALLDGGALLYDVRSEEDYRARHAAGSLSLPDTSIAFRFGELPIDRSLIFY
jgi:rhodanese-related sulfurtransferase